MPLRLDIKRQLSARSDRVKCVDMHPSEPWMLASLYNGTVQVRLPPLLPPSPSSPLFSFFSSWHSLIPFFRENMKVLRWGEMRMHKSSCLSRVSTLAQSGPRTTPDERNTSVDAVGEEHPAAASSASSRASTSSCRLALQTRAKKKPALRKVKKTKKHARNDEDGCCAISCCLNGHGSQSSGLGVLSRCLHVCCQSSARAPFAGPHCHRWCTSFR